MSASGISQLRPIIMPFLRAVCAARSVRYRRERRGTAAGEIPAAVLFWARHGACSEEA